MGSLTRYDIYCPACGYEDTVKHKPDAHCPKCGESAKVEKFGLHSLSALQGRRVRFQPFTSFEGLNLWGLAGTVIDTDGPGQVIWVQLDQEHRELDETGNAVIVDQYDAEAAGHTDLATFFASITEPL